MLLNLTKRIRNCLCDFRFGIHSGGSIAGSLGKDYFRYSTVSYRDIFLALTHLDICSDDIFVDIGCGKGRVICCAAKLGVQKSIGIELDENLVSCAKHNALKLRGLHSPIDIFHVSAEDFDYDSITLFYMFNPFNGNILQTVLSKIHESWIENPRRIRIAYVNPVYDNLIFNHNWLYRDKALIGECHAVSIWHSV